MEFNFTQRTQRIMTAQRGNGKDIREKALAIFAAKRYFD
jgi:hypothetical protein